MTKMQAERWWPFMMPMCWCRRWKRKLPRIYPAVEYARTKDGSRTGETSGDAASSDVCRFLRFQRKECENMGVFRLTGWKLTGAWTGSRIVSCPCLSPGEQTFRQRQLAEKNPLLRLEPGFETSQTFTMLFETALDKALRDMENWRRGDNLQPLLVRLAEYCCKAGIPEEEVVRQTIIHYYA